MEQLVVGVARFVLYLKGCRSLKEKRMVVRRVRDRVTARQNVSIAEVGAQDQHERAVFALALVGTDATITNAALQKVLETIEDMYLAPMIERRVEVIPFGDSFGVAVPFFQDRW